MFRNIFKTLLILVLMCLVNSQKDECSIDGKKGRCVEMKRCFYLIQVFIDKKRPQICYFKENVPYVCCTDCELVDDINQFVIDPQRGPLLKDGKGKSWDYCLDQLNAQPYNCKLHYQMKLTQLWNEDQQCDNPGITAVGAVGGVDAVRGEVPHAALLGYGTEETSVQWLCGGTLINSRFILTAGHCIYTPSVGDVTMAALGILKRSDLEDIWQKYKIEEIIKHPDYHPPAKYNDIALLKTEKRIYFSEFVLPACLPNHKTRDFDWANAVGWGALSAHGKVADILQKVSITKFTEKECTSLFEPSRLLKSGFNTTTQECWGSIYGIQDTCQGDSGGALFANSGCQPEVIGVTSYGRECGFEGQPGVYTRVAHYVPWIESVAWP